MCSREIVPRTAEAMNLIFQTTDDNTTITITTNYSSKNKRSSINCGKSNSNSIIKQWWKHESENRLTEKKNQNLLTRCCNEWAAVNPIVVVFVGARFQPENEAKRCSNNLLWIKYSINKDESRGRQNTNRQFRREWRKEVGTRCRINGW